MIGSLAELLEAMKSGEVQFVTVAELAALTRRSKMSTYRLVHSGEVRAIRLGRAWRISAESALQVMSALVTPGGDAPPLAQRLQSLRRKRGLSQEALASRCGLSSGTVSAIERGRTPDRDSVEKLAAGLRVSMATLAGTQPTELAGQVRDEGSSPGTSTGIPGVRDRVQQSSAGGN